jgi:hypothetical protein
MLAKFNNGDGGARTGPIQQAQTSPNLLGAEFEKSPSSSSMLRGVLGTVKAVKQLKRSTSKSKVGSASDLSAPPVAAANSRLSVGQRRALMLKHKGGGTNNSSTSLLGKHNG